MVHPWSLKRWQEFALMITLKEPTPIGWSRLNLTVLRICKNFNAAVRSRLFCKI